MPTRDFYTLAEAARVLEIPQRRLLEMLEAVDELLSPAPSPEGSAEEFPDRSAEMIQELIDELGTLQSEVGRLRNRLNLAQRTDKEEKDLLLAELEQERERYRNELERADRLQVEANRL